MTLIKILIAVLIAATLASHGLLVPGLIIMATWYVARRTHIQISIFRCPRCHKAYNNPLTHTHARRPARAAR